MLKMQVLRRLWIDPARRTWVLYDFCWGECVALWVLWGHRYQREEWMVQWLLQSPLRLEIQVEVPGI